MDTLSDEPDNEILECAVAANAEAVVRLFRHVRVLTLPNCP